MQGYEDFLVEITLAGDVYALRASALGEVARAETTFRESGLAFQNRLQAVEIVRLQAGRGRRRVVSRAEQELQELGELLFDFLFTGDVLALYDRSRQEVARQEKGLRLKLSIADPALAELPWEYLYDRREGEFVTLSRSTPIVRFLEVRTVDRPLRVQLPLRVLGLIASPAGWEPLDVEQEKARLEAGLQPLLDRGLAELVWLEGQTWRDIQAAMRGGPWHIFHFIGHGGYDEEREEGMVLLVDDAGQEAPLHATELARLLADHPSLRFVFLNACEGATGSDASGFASAAATLVRRGVAAVLAMQYDISDQAAIEFARSFYEALADGLPVDGAVTEARKAVSLATPGSPEWGAPVLFMQVEDGRLFDLQPVQESGSARDQGPQPAPPNPERPRRVWSRTGGAALAVLLLLVAVGYVFRSQLGLTPQFPAPTSPETEQVASTPEVLTPETTTKPSVADAPGLSTHPEDGNAAMEAFQAGKEALNAAEYGIAVEQLERAIALGLRSVEVFLTLAEAQAATGDADGALASVDHAQLLDDRDCRVYAARAQIFMDRERGGPDGDKMDDYREAKRQLDMALSLCPKKPDLYITRAEVFRALGDNQLALDDLNTALTLAPDIPYYWSERGLYYMEMGNWTRAVSDFTEAIRLEPDGADYYYLRGRSFAELGQIDEAVANYRKFLTLVKSPAPYQVEYVAIAEEYLRLHGQ